MGRVMDYETQMIIILNDQRKFGCLSGVLPGPRTLFVVARFRVVFAT